MMEQQATFRGQLVEIRRFGLAAEGADVGIAEIVRDDQQNVRALFRSYVGVLFVAATADRCGQRCQPQAECDHASPGRELWIANAHCDSLLGMHLVSISAGTGPRLVR